MKKLVFGGVLSLVLVLFSCQSKKESTETDETGQQIALITDYNDLFAKFTKNDEKLYVINYWATWCKPCIEELPEFMEVNNELKDNTNFKMILVSLDKYSALETDLKSFIEKKNMPSDVYLMSDNNRQMEWIPLVNERWSGAIPATALYKNGKQLSFSEGTLTKEQLKELIHKHL